MRRKGEKIAWTKFKCEICQKEKKDTNSNYKRRKHHFCSRECQIKWQKIIRIGEKNPYWNPIKKIYKYKKITTKEGRNTEHRVIMETLIGRKLTNKEQIHHIDGDTTNNNISNLVLCKDKKEHKHLYHRKIHFKTPEELDYNESTQEGITFEKARLNMRQNSRDAYRKRIHGKRV